MQHPISVEGAAAVFECAENRSVLESLFNRGSNAVAVGCRSGGCGVCRVQVLAGEYETGAMSQAQVGDADRAAGIALACRLYPRSALRIRALGRSGCERRDPVADLLHRLGRRQRTGETT